MKCAIDPFNDDSSYEADTEGPGFGDEWVIVVDESGYDGDCEEESDNQD